ncbi:MULTISPECIES: hypothetical protein [unclassified Polaribacter]|uniref:hypothetical protein n=1 Tax=unclassified Polaribacter TaxID=196858 RepID=UPI0011BFADAF|nr:MULTISPECIES: hypothetical protein [unclassified Polaribacter]TXD53542.1 hypothetical protein ES043_03925 [Polaribacter sp. IC063]TXD58614.1 hypothetical protein ES044_11890 [Polaribacter sp. IC066]
MNTFSDIKELVSTLKREEKLISEMFSKRKKLDYKLSDAQELVDFDENRVDFLTERNVLRKNGNLLELDDDFLEFFEKVLDVNEEINLSYIDENIKNIKENINYFLNETNENRKYDYLRLIKKTFRKMGIITLKSVVDLRRNIETTFKNEVNYKNKKLKLENLDAKRTVVENLIKQTLQLIDEEETTFFNRGLDEELKRIIVALKYQLGECSHNLIEIEKQIINFLNQIKIQGKFLEKLRKLKYLKDHFTIEAETDIKQVLAHKNEIIFETKIFEPLNVSIDLLRSDEKAFEAIKRIAKNQQNRKLFKPVLADTISDEFLENNVEQEIAIVLEEVRNGFLATSDHLFNFIINYHFGKNVTFNERVTIFCQMASQYELEFKIKTDFQISNGVEYALIYPK